MATVSVMTMIQDLFEGQLSYKVDLHMPAPHESYMKLVLQEFDSRYWSVVNIP